MSKIRVLVVDDSALMRRVITDMLGEDPEIEVIGTARDGYDAIKKIHELKPDVVTLDIEMPKLDGLNTLGYIMSEVPLPVIMLSSYTREGAEATLKALEYGAFDFVPKPSGPISLDIRKVKEELIAKIKAAYRADLSRLKFLLPKRERKIEKVEKAPSLKVSAVVAIASSTGGPRALQEVIPKLPADIKASILIVQHMPKGFTKSLADRLDSLSQIDVKEAKENDILTEGTALVAPGDYHMVIKGGEEGAKVKLTQDPPVWGVRPSADVTMSSVADLFKGRVVGVVLTGMGRDGANGLRKIKEYGGVTIAEDKSTCVVFGMPKVAIEEGAADVVAPLHEIADRIVDAVKRLS
ncbi:MAG: two-component system, chemotaxis family, protein-glutamate methylesterase/glutaminase [bacterium]|nr:two-component system, chemotaxis family, protein-glutamate methylesterase/glutaminase [bacterium]